MILCEGPHMACCLKKLGCPSEKISVHHLGIEIDKIPFIPRKYTPGDSVRILIAASFREKKGIPYALEALGEFNKMVPVDVTIIGDSSYEKRSKIEKKKY